MTRWDRRAGLLYRAQIGDMTKRIEKWTAEHGDPALVFLLNVPRDVGPIASLDTLVCSPMLETSPAARDLVVHLVGEYPANRCPTWIQLQCALQIVNAQRRLAQRSEA